MKHYATKWWDVLSIKSLDAQLIFGRRDSNMKTYVAYIRVSTSKQGRDGLGMAVGLTLYGHLLTIA